MKIRYYCRQCEQQVGELDTKEVDASQIGSDVLNDSDDSQTIHMQNDGALDIRTLCDSCKEATAQHTYQQGPDTLS
ncbi:anti-sigma-F factor Fin [Halobacillus seohaensis]|uniref:Anti-sigma-F factor Fin n=1 Tax=Halobacillus seohaensis TaxID=447421 RepID=A0ABW2EPE9_9BACI